MRWLADECVAPEIVRALRSDGHDVVSIFEDFRGLPDAAVLVMAGREDRLLLTEGSDFGELIFRRGFRPIASGVSSSAGRPDGAPKGRPGCAARSGNMAMGCSATIW